MRYKFLILTAALLTASVVVHLYLALNIFKQDKTELIYDLNRSLVTNIANEVQQRIDRAFDQLEINALVRDSKPSQIKTSSDLMLVAEVYVDGRFKVQNSNSEYLKLYGIDNQDEWIATQLKMMDVFSEDSQLIKTHSDSPVVILSRLIVIENQNSEKIGTRAIIGVLNLEKIQSALQSSQTSEVFLADRSGTVILSNTQEAKISEVLKSRALAGQSDTSVFSFEDSNSEKMGAYRRGSHTIVYSQIDSNKAFAAVMQLIRRSILFGVITVLTAFLLILMFSKTITRPLDQLMNRMADVRNGDLKTEINLKSNDEISVLAHTFNSMIRDLRSSRDQLEEINRDLEQKVADRTKRLELQNLAVKEAQEALLRTTRLASVGEIAGRAAHEVLNPLTSILARLEKLQSRLNNSLAQESKLLTEIQLSWKKDYDSGGFEKLVSSWKSPSSVLPGATLWEEDNNNLAEISKTFEVEVDKILQDTAFLVSESHRINRIVSQMRTLSHTQSEKKEHSIHEVINESIKVMADLFDKERIKMSSQLTASFDTAIVNKDELLQTITNLLRNSLQSIRDKKIKNGSVLIETKNKSNSIEIYIKDNGLGIKDDLKLKLFESQISTKDPSEGTGLGLSISRRFVRSFNGDIILYESKFGEGATFCITLPLSAIHLKEVGT